MATFRMLAVVAAAVLQALLSADSLAGDSTNCSCVNSSKIACRCQGAWFIAESPNFQVCSLHSFTEAKAVARHCECLRTQLVDTWNEGAGAWKPRCQVLLHNSRSDYLRAVGQGGEATLGSSLVKPNSGVVRTRRIDLRVDIANYLTAALPHELCHVVLADRFRDRAAPLWFDEGVALQYDPAEKQRLHERDRQTGLQRGTAYPLPELLAIAAIRRSIVGTSTTVKAPRWCAGC